MTGLSGRSVFVTGAYGLLGSWLAKALLERGARVTVLRRDAVARSALALEGTEARVNVVVGDICDGALMERVLSEYEVDTVFHLAAQTIVGVANRSPVSTFEANIRGTWTVAESLPEMQPPLNFRNPPCPGAPKRSQIPQGFRCPWALILPRNGDTHNDHSGRHRTRYHPAG